MSKKQEAITRQEIPVLVADPSLGLTAQQAQERAEGGWAGGDPPTSGKSVKDIVLSNIFTFFNGIFLVLGVLLVVSGSSVMNLGFLVIAGANTIIGIGQELRAKRAVDKLTLVAQKPVRVVRDGDLQAVAISEIVRDDIAEFSQGDQLCADGILREGTLWVDESQITGEADAVTKEPGDEVRSGSVVMSGQGLVQLTAVGADAFVAQLSQEAKANPKARKTEMMRSLDRLILVVGIALVPVGLAMFFQEYKVLGLTFQASVEGTVAALIGMIPEGLYLLTSIAIAASALKLSRRRVLVRDMNCIESLARVDVLCVDKTGTITEPDMEVEDLIPLGEVKPERLEDILTALYGGKDQPENATAKAIRELFDGRSRWTEEARVPFSPEYKWSGASFRGEGSFVTGAPEFLMGNRFGELDGQIRSWTENGRRVLLLAAYDGELAPGDLEPDKLTPLALVILTGKVRERAKETFEYFAQQGVSVRVISGDDPRTVSYIAGKAGIPGSERFVDATTLETDQDFAQAVQDNIVFGRVTPDQKRRLIAALQRQKHTVAMTGDGVNDLLAMKQADCSIGMASGAQAASQLASLVLLDSDFSAMPGIVGEGRRVINNIQRAATLFLVKNIFSLFLSIISLFTEWPYPLLPVHLSVISALTIGIPSFFLAMEPNYDRVKGHFLRGVLRRAFPGGLTNVFAVLVCQAFMAVFGLTIDEIYTVCAGILAIVGMMVLFQVCKPFNGFRALVWNVMLVGLVVVFTLLGELFQLRSGSLATKLLLLTLLLMTPTVFFTIQRIFDWGERVYNRLLALPQQGKAGLRSLGRKLFRKFPENPS